ncbi:4-(cytidine 5'-diphospho)-2-C-methyl-D-erythritol kinase [Thalassotalea mangrovi]|uniref:4-diphosphocytidyl-2-C-methyl-D-erythritol kinase n=1 Tax=Thalassotalea mangrovi TaxID=2572245 RepID=A0A4U1B644_9GAMM|nr:4-(cytidine 5'-diphospho)-2-C-methyl-D-erythritol kinase [Thalassotalea mangrovi]TKB45943.1 4-(cytidine 5'-diphospho)-2-C-methyl-D-erythritol kinase [Thalassotalea mangrovi]
MNHETYPSLSFSAPAKINRFLHITNRREDGYHELETVFQFLDIADTLTFTRRNDNAITLTPGIPGVALADNLIFKAAKRLQDFAVQQQLVDTPPGVSINLDKQLPMGGGLGGGSSNAATTLLALNRIWKLNIDTETLARLGLQLGADVPIFVHGHSAFAEGVGEIITPVDIDCPVFLITVPSCHISTASIFQHPQLPRTTARLTTEQRVNLDLQQLQNDCEKLVTELYPEVAKLMAWLLEYAPSRLTGTGGCIFSSFTSVDDAQRVQSKLPPNIKSFIAKGVNSSPLLAELKLAELKQQTE